jgi:large subunit ribosomal protein L34e
MSTTRVTYRRKNTYRTKSNQVRKFRTPGGKLLVQYRNKQIKRLTCSETGQILNGIPRVSTRLLPKRKRTVTRPYGGVLSAGEVQQRIKRAFLNEEMKVIKLEAQRSKKANKKIAKKK